MMRQATDGRQEQHRAAAPAAAAAAAAAEDGSDRPVCTMCLCNYDTRRDTFDWILGGMPCCKQSVHISCLKKWRVNNRNVDDAYVTNCHVCRAYVPAIWLFSQLYRSTRNYFKHQALLQRMITSESNQEGARAALRTLRDLEAPAFIRASTPWRDPIMPLNCALKIEKYNLETMTRECERKEVREMGRNAFEHNYTRALATHFRNIPCLSPPPSPLPPVADAPVAGTVADDVELDTTRMPYGDSTASSSGIRTETATNGGNSSSDLDDDETTDSPMTSVAASSSAQDDDDEDFVDSPPRSNRQATESTTERVIVPSFATRHPPPTTSIAATEAVTSSDFQDDDHDEFMRIYISTNVWEPTTTSAAVANGNSDLVLDSVDTPQPPTIPLAAAATDNATVDGVPPPPPTTTVTTNSGAPVDDGFVESSSPSPKSRQATTTAVTLNDPHTLAAPEYTVRIFPAQFELPEMTEPQQHHNDGDNMDSPTPSTSGAPTITPVAAVGSRRRNNPDDDDSPPPLLKRTKRQAATVPAAGNTSIDSDDDDFVKTPERFNTPLAVRRRLMKGSRRKEEQPRRRQDHQAAAAAETASSKNRCRIAKAGVTMGRGINRYMRLASTCNPLRLDQARTELEKLKENLRCQERYFEQMKKIKQDRDRLFRSISQENQERISAESRRSWYEDTTRAAYALEKARYSLKSITLDIRFKTQELEVLRDRVEKENAEDFFTPLTNTRLDFQD